MTTSELLEEILLGFNIGEPTIIKNKTIPYLKVKRGVDYLKTKGYDFTIQTAGRIDDVIVTRLK
uniref:Uncharacterized protein n=1 Tax=Siphoviridae sp. ctZE52 TaxID=2825557 RepID=A0A8S5P227_9CAUD|nr:MAG TPA: hypothetical protein [Siphoviridae sp. ctZE52]